jgi:hypothetical protein
MGSVYRARDTETGEDVALKILPPEMAAKQAMVVRFKREYAAASRLRHENIVSLLEFGEAAGTLYFAMEYVEGTDLHEHLEVHGVIDPEEARGIILQAARAIRHAAQHGIVHRDIKPSNFLLTTRSGKRTVKLLDFGLAREASGDEFRVTRAGTTVGTIDYMSPEQARDSSLADVRSDLYSLGSTWYHLLTGQSPFPDGGLGERLIRIMNDPPRDARELNPLVSDETWAILEKLLAKEPEERYQTAEELIEDLLSLEGKATARPRARPPGRKGKKKARSSAEQKEATEPASRERGLLSRPWALAMLAAAVVVALVAALIYFRGRSPEEQPKPPEEEPPITDKDGEKDRGKDGGTPPGPRDKGHQKDKGKSDDGGKEKPPPSSRYPVLCRLPTGVTAAELRQEADRPWASVKPPLEAVVTRVRRVGGEGFHRSIAEAIAAMPAGKAGVIEVHDNGPLFELPASSSGRALTLRAGKGFRPLIVWDVLAAIQAPGFNRSALLALISSRGPLEVEGVEVACRWPDTAANPGAFFHVTEGDLTLRRCTFSLAGRPRSSVALAVQSSQAPGARCRVSNCRLRGQGLSGLDLSAPAAEALIEGSLLTGAGPVVRAQASEKPTSLHIVRSTLAATGELISLAPLPGERRPGLNVLAWDSILARTGAPGGEMLVTAGEMGGVRWRSVAALYAGWGKLLGGAKAVTGLEEWRALWGIENTDRLLRDPWPDLPPDESGSRAAADYLPAGPVAFGTAADPDVLFGCPVDSLPPARDGWLALAHEPGLSVPEIPMEPPIPAIPMPGDGMFHGARLNLDENDLGRYLEMMQSRTTFAPRVVLHLFGRGERVTSPIRVKGYSLALYFERPADEKSGPLALKPGFGGPGGPMIDVEGGSLEIVGGILRCPESAALKLSHIVRVTGGGLRLFRTRIEGPRIVSPEGYLGAVQVRCPSDEGASRKPAEVTLSECLIVSSRAGLEVEGAGARLSLRHCALVAGTDALAFLPGPKSSGRADLQASLSSCTLASRRAALRLGDVAPGAVPDLPVQVRTSDCAFLNPFPGKPSRAGMLVYEGDALSRGLLIWHSERDALDPRLHFGAAPSSGLPEAREAKSAWHRLWGSAGLTTPRPDLPGGLSSFTPKAWPLEALILSGRDPPGAALSRLGITRSKRP